MASATARSIRADVESRIASGELRPDEQLPSVRRLAGELNVSPATVSAAYRDLRQRGMVVGRGRQGTRVTPARAVESNTPESITGLVDAQTGSPDPDLLPSLAPALVYAASLPQPRYGGPLVEENLAAAGTSLFASDSIEATHLTVTSGAMDAVERVLAALDLRIGDRIGVEDPGHFPVHQLARASGLELVSLPVDEQGITAEGLDAAVRLGVRAIVVTPRAHNPTGASFTEDRTQALDRVLDGHPAIAVIQDDHAGLIVGTDYQALTPPGPRWATMRSLGKSFGPDVRLALVTGDEQTIHRVSTGLSNGPGWVSYILQRVAAFMLEDPATAIALRAATESYDRRRDRLIGALAEYGIAATGPSGLNVWIPTNDERSAIVAARAAGYSIRRATAYRLHSPTAVRVTISGLDDTDIDTITTALGHQNPGPTHAPSL